MSAIGRLLREPLVHFLVLGGLLFAFFAWKGGGAGPGSTRIAITPGLVEHLASGFAKTWQRPPTDAEIKGLIDEQVKEEIATREAVAMGLDRDDTIIRRRLRQKLEFLAEDTIDLAPPTDAELQAWLDAHPADFRVEAAVAFRQVYVNPDRHGASAETEARAILARLVAAGEAAAIDTAGDPLMLPHEVERSRRTDVARQFGDEFADAILKIEPGRWAGPLRSGYGLHLVFVREREEGRQLTLVEARPQVEREFTSDRRRRQLDAMYEGLLDRYQVVIEKRPAPPAATSAPGVGAKQ